jgi:hypothetical protein
MFNNLKENTDKKYKTKLKGSRKLNPIGYYENNLFVSILHNLLILFNG